MDRSGNGPTVGRSPTPASGSLAGCGKNGLEGAEPLIDLYISRVRCDSGAQLAACMEMLTTSELSEASRFVSPSARDQFVVSRGLLRWSLSKRLDIPPLDLLFGRTSYGKPHLIGQRSEQAVQFNVSHCPSMVAVALGEAEAIGVDVETLKRSFDISALSAYCMSGDERRVYNCLSNGCRRQAFLRYWTVKEAYTKAVGVGLGMDLRDVNCWFSDDGSTFGFSYPFRSCNSWSQLFTWQWEFSGEEVLTLVSTAQEIAGNPIKPMLVSIGADVVISPIRGPSYQGRGIPVYI